MPRLLSQAIARDADVLACDAKRLQDFHRRPRAFCLCVCEVIAMKPVESADDAFLPRFLSVI